MKIRELTKEEKDLIESALEKAYEASPFYGKENHEMIESGFIERLWVKED